MDFQYQQKHYTVERYPLTKKGNLQAWNAADEHLLQHLENITLEQKELAILNDRFGFLSCLTHAYAPSTIQTNHSHEKALRQNLLYNQIKDANVSSYTVFNIPIQSFDIGLLKIPKSLELFRLYLQVLSSKWKQDAVLFCGFMTRHFSPQILTIATTFFEDVQQSRAWKKSRVLILKSPRKFEDRTILHQIPFQGRTYQQYFGVFSAKHIDYASQFLIANLDVDLNEKVVLDLASGNGILAATVRQNNANCTLHLLDDSHLAIASSKLNLSSDNTFFHCNNDLSIFEENYFDCVLSNPPFHFEYEVSIETSVQLFKEVYNCLKPNGRFIIVANKHLNYKTHLQRLLFKVTVVNENEKFVIYECRK